jgi:hypothetical protein
VAKCTYARTQFSRGASSKISPGKVGPKLRVEGTKDAALVDRTPFSLEGGRTRTLCPQRVRRAAPHLPDDLVRRRVKLTSPRTDATKTPLISRLAASFPDLYNPCCILVSADEIEVAPLRQPLWLAPLIGNRKGTGNDELGPDCEGLGQGRRRSAHTTPCTYVQLESGCGIECKHLSARKAIAADDELQRITYFDSSHRQGSAAFQNPGAYGTYVRRYGFHF